MERYKTLKVEIEALKIESGNTEKQGAQKA
jgi:hypothetical protein